MTPNTAPNTTLKVPVIPANTTAETAAPTFQPTGPSTKWAAMTDSSRLKKGTTIMEITWGVIFRKNFSRYTRVVWKLEGGGFADCLMVATVAAIVSYIPIGSIAGKVGRKKTILGGIVLMSICYLAAIFVGAYHPVINVAFAAIGVGWAAINVNSYPMIVEMGKGCDIGKFTGTYYTFSMTAQIFTPVLSGFLLENISYRTLFPYAFVFSALAFFTMSQVRHGDVRPEKKRSMLENFDVDD